MRPIQKAQVVIVGGGLAGLSAAIYLARARRSVLLVDSGKSMARWEPRVENYLGFPKGVSGENLIASGREQAKKYGLKIIQDKVLTASRSTSGLFKLTGQRGRYQCNRVLLATGIFHIPPDIPGIIPCLGHSMFFCKDCDGHRVQGKRLAVYGWTNEAAEYALGMLLYSPTVSIVTDRHTPRWDARHSRLLKYYGVPVYEQCIRRANRKKRHLKSLEFEDGTSLPVQALFTTRGDIYFNKLAKALGARVDQEGQIHVDRCMQTTTKGVYAAGCVTPANCQMIIAAGQGAIAAQAINRDLFVQSLKTRTLHRLGAGETEGFRKPSKGPSR